MNIQHLTQRCIALSLLIVAVLQLFSGHVLIGRPPDGLAGDYEMAVAYLASLLLIASAVYLTLDRANHLVIRVTAVFIVCYCVLPNLWLLVNGDIGIALTSFGKGISLATGLFFLNTARRAEDSVSYSHTGFLLFVAGLGCFFAFSGIQHFIFKDFVKTLVPGWIPFPIFWTYFTGVLLLVTGICLTAGIKRKLVAQYAALMIFLWIVLIHVPRMLTYRNINETTAFSEALAFASLLVVIALSAEQARTKTAGIKAPGEMHQVR